MERRVAIEATRPNSDMLLWIFILSEELQAITIWRADALWRLTVLKWSNVIIIGQDHSFRWQWSIRRSCLRRLWLLVVGCLVSWRRLMLTGNGCFRNQLRTSCLLEVNHVNSWFGICRMQDSPKVQDSNFALVGVQRSVCAATRGRFETETETTHFAQIPLLFLRTMEVLRFDSVGSSFVSFWVSSCHQTFLYFFSHRKSVFCRHRSGIKVLLRTSKFYTFTPTNGIVFMRS